MSDKICDFRLEAEYYSKIYEKLSVNLNKNRLVELSTLVKSKITTGHTPSMKNEKFYGGRISFIKTDNLRDNFIKAPFSNYLSELGDNKIKKSRLKEFDIITTIIGATYKIIGRSCLVNTTMLPANINQNIALIRADIKKINPYYLNVYMQSLYGKLYLHWLARQTEQVNLNCEEVGKLNVARFSNSFEERLAELNKKSYKLNIISNEKYSQAENLLITELGLENFKPSSEKVSIKTLKESFLKTGRLDSEYYQVKYDEYLQKIKLDKYTTISNEFGLIKEKMTNGLGSYNYIEIGDVNVSDGKSIPKLIDEKDLPANAKIMPQKGDLLVSKVRPNRGAISIIEEDYSNLIVSGAFTVLREKKESNYKVETLKTLLRTTIYSDWLLKFNVGTSYPVIADEDILSLPIPIIKFNVQDEIVSYIKQSMEYSKKAKNLLDISIKAVEIAIEKDEQTAQNFLDRQTDPN